MGKLVLSILSVVCFGGVAFAQTTADIIKQDPRKAACSFYVYDYQDTPEVTPAPEGYKPFYISQFARHGARYCTNEYNRLYEWFSKAEETGVLTREGKKFFASYKAFYQKVKDCGGNLTGVGKAQHRAIAEHLYQRFPSVFEGPTHVEAVSTEASRVIMSMWSCLSQLAALDEDMEVNADASTKYASWLQPAATSNPYYYKEGFKASEKALKEVSDYFRKEVPWEEIAQKFFTSADVLETVLKITPEKFIASIHGVATGSQCLDHDQKYFDGLFTEEQLYAMWKGQSARYFLDLANYVESGHKVLDYSHFTLGQIIESADADMASGKTQLRLCYGHDSGIAPLIAVLNLNGYGEATSSFEEGLHIFPSYCVPMGASVQLVFFRNAEGDVLVKVLLNEKEATLPIEAAYKSYYRWLDIKNYYLPRIQAAKEKIAFAALDSVDWGWRSVSGSKVEVGTATVKVFGAMQTISMVRFPIAEHTLSVYESDGPAANVTSGLGEVSGALAAINASFFNKQKFPTEYVKDDGKVVCTLPAKGETRANAMLRIKDKKGKSIDILQVVDSIGTVKAAKGWYEAIVSGPVLMQDGQIVDYSNDTKRVADTFHSRRHPRTLMGYTAEGWVYFIVVDGRFLGKGEGMTIPNLQTLCKYLGLYEAMNFDGGGSSTLWTKEYGVINHPYDNHTFDHKGERKVPNALIVK